MLDCIEDGLESVLEIFFSDPFKISCTTNVLFYTCFYIIFTCTAEDLQSLIYKAGLSLREWPPATFIGK